MTLREQLTGRLDELIANVVALAEINSGTHNPDGVNRCAERLAEQVEALRPDRVEMVPVDPTPIVTENGEQTSRPVGNALRVTKRADTPFQVCLFGHLDTVFPAEHPFQTVAVSNHRLHGPGVADCKGGLVLATEVLRHVETVEWGQQIGWEFLVVPDEEVGSVGSQPLLRAAAGRCNIGLGFEPALPSGGVAGARKGTLNGHTVVRGRAAHAGRAHHEGRSAVRGLARLIDTLEELNERDGVTVNFGRISGGGPTNVVPDFAMGAFNLRVGTAEDSAWIRQQFERVTARTAAAHELEIELIWGSSRDPKPRTPALDQLLADVASAADEAGLQIAAEDTGGCCDGNDLAAAGLPNVDSLGICGGNIHSSQEFAEVGSIAERVPVVVEVLRRAYRRSVA
ncbi:MAG: hydrolase [Acidimicrobiales bacterium]|nr:hydrolase [Acidimicrobiales bacterium]